MRTKVPARRATGGIGERGIEKGYEHYLPVPKVRYPVLDFQPIAKRLRSAFKTVGLDQNATQQRSAPSAVRDPTTIKMMNAVMKKKRQVAALKEELSSLRLKHDSEMRQLRKENLDMKKMLAHHLATHQKIATLSNTIRRKAARSLRKI